MHAPFLSTSHCEFYGAICAPMYAPIRRTQYFSAACNNICLYLQKRYAKQKHPGCKKVRGQSEAAL